MIFSFLLIFNPRRKLLPAVQLNENDEIELFTQKLKQFWIGNFDTIVKLNQAKTYGIISDFLLVMVLAFLAFLAQWRVLHYHHHVESTIRTFRNNLHIFQQRN